MTEPSSDGGLGSGGGWDDDLDLGDEDLDFGGPPVKSQSRAEDDGDFFAAPQPGTRPAAHWVNNSSHAADHVAAGSFESAMRLLNNQLAVVNFEPLKKKFVGVYCGATTSVPGLALAPSLSMPLQRSTPADQKSLPAVAAQLPWLIDLLKSAYKAFWDGKFEESLALFKSIMCTIPMLIPGSKSERTEV